MFNRFLLWLSACVVAAGVSTAMVAGAGLAFADDGTTSGTGSGSSSQSSNSTGKKADSRKEGSKPKPKKEPPASNEQSADPAGKDTEQPAEAASSGTTKRNDHEAAEPTASKMPDRLDTPAAASAPEVKKEAKKADDTNDAVDAKVADVQAQAESIRGG